MTQYSPWADLASQPDLTLAYRPLVGRLGEYDHRTKTITLLPDLVRRQRRSVLAHELRHAFYGDRGCVPHQERRADREAARLLIPVRDLGHALRIHDGHHSAAAAELNVSDHLLRVRLGALHPSEAHLLRRLVGELESVA